MIRTVLVLTLLQSGAAAPQPAVKIVGIGAASCARFNQEIGTTPTLERDYLGWAQGFMSGALMRAPAGVDEDLDLLPPSRPLQDQAAFLRDFCRAHPDQDYMDAVRALYHLLRGPKL